MTGPLNLTLDTLKAQIQLENSEQVRADALEKQRRLREWMTQNGYDGVLISRRDQFAWLTAGGDRPGAQQRHHRRRAPAHYTGQAVSAGAQHGCAQAV